MTVATTTKTLIQLDNGQNVWTQSNVAADIAGLINAGSQKIYACTEYTTGQPHNIVVSHIIDVIDVPL
jgi:hypothetical protein